MDKFRRLPAQRPSHSVVSGHSITRDIQTLTNYPSYGLPSSFLKDYLSFAKNRYIYNVRGHDCFAFLGQWKRETKGHTPASPHMLAEISALKTLAKDNKANGYHEDELILGLGPGPGSFFADAYELERYRWSNLPIDLEDEIQKEICRKGYGKIYNIAINSDGGWVIQRDKGRDYDWGGALPRELEYALSEGKKKKTPIQVCSYVLPAQNHTPENAEMFNKQRLYLNHQNQKDYVLIFTDATVFLSLHQGFEESLKPLIASTFSKRAKLKWHFIPSCDCGGYLQNEINAKYYNQRGNFHFIRKNYAQALTYLREAKTLVPSNTDYQYDFAMGLVKMRAENPLQFEANHALKDQFTVMTYEIGDIEGLEERGRHLQKQAQQEPLHEWACKQCPGTNTK